MNYALGLVETKGLVAAIEAANAMVNTSNVTIEGKEVSSEGFVTVKVRGEITSVKTAVEIGAQAAYKIGEVISVHVIEEISEELKALFSETSEKKEDIEIKEEKITKPEVKAKKIRADKSKKEKEVIKEENYSLFDDSAFVDDLFSPEIKNELPSDLENGNDAKTINDKKNLEEPQKLFIEEKKEIVSAPQEKEIIIEQKTIIAKNEDNDRNKTLVVENKKEIEKSINTSLDQEKEKQLLSSQPDEEIHDEYEKMNVHELRKLSRTVKDFPIQGRNISKANRKVLIDYLRKIPK
jgi:ethanolamine utilization protein EutM